LSFLTRHAGFADQLVNSASLNLFRFLFGLFVFVEAIRFLLHRWVDTYLLNSTVLFKYLGLEWVQLLPGDWLYIHFGAIALLAIMVALGVFYRLAIVGLTLSFGYVFMLEQALYLNQYYLLLTISFLLCFMPAERGFSLDTIRRRESLECLIPLWNIAALRFQFEVMLIYAGIVKLNPDWLRGEPLTLWLNQRMDIPVIGSWLGTPGLGETASIAVVALHLIGAPLLLIRKTRLAVFLLYVPFHLANSMLFHIGLFPWITLAGTLLFFDPDWPLKVWHRYQGGREAIHETSPKVATPYRTSGLTLTIIIVFLVSQVLIPARALFYPGRASWTGEGDWFAWRMKLDDKACTSTFTVTDLETGRRTTVNPEDHLNARQLELLPSNPDMLLQFAQHLQRVRFKPAELDQVKVTARIYCALNGRQAQLLIDEHLDLAQVERSWRHYSWIQPLTVTLRETNNASQ
jgi:hypothetical protein